MNNQLHQTYVEMSVATAKIERRANAAHAEFDRWLSRIKLAERLGKPDLARQARQRALQIAEREVKLRAFLVTQQDWLEAVRELAR